MTLAIIQHIENQDEANRTHKAADGFFGETIYSYTRQQALDDGVLIDITEAAAEAGFKIEVALTVAAYEDCVSWADADNQQAYQDEAGRLWDILTMAIYAAKKGAGSSCVSFHVLRIPKDGKSRAPKVAHLKMEIGPTEEGVPAITIMQSNED